MKKAEKALAYWYSGCSGYVQICRKGDFHLGFLSIDCLDPQEALEFELDQAFLGHPDVFMSVCTIKSPSRRHDNASDIPGIWVDLDFKNFKGGEAEAEELLKRFPHKPSLVIHSGGGWHCYWKFRFPQKPNDDVLFLLRHVTGLVTADPAPAHFAALLRLPGTANSKYIVGSGGEDPVFARVKIDLERSTWGTYIFEELFSVVKDIPRETKLGYSSANTVEDFSLPRPLVNIPEKFNRLLLENEKVRKTWEGDRPGLRDQSRSGYDWSMTCLLVYRGYTEEEILRILLEMPSGKGKEKGIPYLMNGIQKARQEKERCRVEPIRVTHRNRIS